MKFMDDDNADRDIRGVCLRTSKSGRLKDVNEACCCCCCCCCCLCEAGVSSNEETDLDGLASGDVNVLLLLTVMRAVPCGEDLLILVLKLSFDLHITAAIIEFVFILVDTFRLVSLSGVRTRDDVEDVDEELDDNDEEAFAEEDEEEEIVCSIGVEFFISFEVSGLTGEIKELSSLLILSVLLLSVLLLSLLLLADTLAQAAAVPSSSEQ